MADQEKDKRMQIDDMLDSLLANYSSAEPRPGLETRILANLREAEGREVSVGWLGFKWLWAGVLVAAIVVIAVLISGKRQIVPPVHTVVGNVHPAVHQPEVQPSMPVTASKLPVSHRNRTSMSTVPRNAALALSQRPAVFPTPTPLSEQETLMFTYLANTPQEIVIAQIPRSDDQKEAEAFWADREPTGTRGSTNTR